MLHVLGLFFGVKVNPALLSLIKICGFYYFMEFWQWPYLIPVLLLKHFSLLCWILQRDFWTPSVLFHVYYVRNLCQNLFYAHIYSTLKKGIFKYLKVKNNLVNYVMALKHELVIWQPLLNTNKCNEMNMYMQVTLERVKCRSHLKRRLMHWRLVRWVTLWKLIAAPILYSGQLDKWPDTHIILRAAKQVTESPEVYAD